MAGNYVTTSYHQRGAGYDWVGVRVLATSDSTAHIAVRSRADLKKTTCFLNIDTRLMNDSTLQGSYNGATLLFHFKEKELNISAADDSIVWALSFPCSGGAALNSDSYFKIDEELDPKQVDQTVFFKFIPYGEFNFYVSVKGDEVTIETLGFETNEPIKFSLSGQLVNDADAGDLNGDGFPEIVIYTTLPDSPQMSLIGYSPNKGKSFSSFNYRPFTDDPELRKGFRGGNEFALMEGVLSQRFPLYNQVGEQTGTRQIQYKLVEGEAMRQLVVDKVIEY